MGKAGRNKSKESEPRKLDLDRVGLFKEEGYLHSEPPYIPPNSFVWNINAHKGKQMSTIFPGHKDATSAGYFSEFTRIFEEECVSEPMKEFRRKKKALKEAHHTKEFLYSSPGKKIVGSGNYHGTFGGPVEAISPQSREKSRRGGRKNFYIGVPKKGSGYGVVRCTINDYPEALDQFPQIKTKQNMKQDFQPRVYNYYGSYPDYFDKNPYVVSKDQLDLYKMPSKMKPKHSLHTPFKPPGRGKKLGGCKAGCFPPVPPQSEAAPSGPIGPKFSRKARLPYLTAGFKTSPFVSTLQTNVSKMVTPLTYKDIEGVMYIKQDSTTRSMT